MNLLLPCLIACLPAGGSSSVATSFQGTFQSGGGYNADESGSDGAKDVPFKSSSYQDISSA